MLLEVQLQLLLFLCYQVVINVFLIKEIIRKGDHVISVDDVYGGTQRYFRKVSSISRFNYNSYLFFFILYYLSGINFDFVDFTKEGALESAFTPKTKVKKIYISKLFFS